MRYVLHDRDTKFCPSFQSVLAAGGVKTMALPARSRNLNAFAERWVRSAKEECLSKLILFGEGPLSRTLAEFSAHYHGERNHQGKGNKLLFPDASNKTERRGHAVECRQRLRRTAQVLCPRHMNSLSIREAAFNRGTKCPIAVCQLVCPRHAWTD
jgi:hypothetical protein